MRTHRREKRSLSRVRRIMTRCSILKAYQCFLRPDISPGTAQLPMGIKEIILFITSLGRVPLTYHSPNIASMLGFHCHHCRESRTMLKQILTGILVALWFLSSASGGLAKEILFQAEPANYDYARGVGKKLGEAYRTEFDPRMFPHGTWHQRLSYNSYEPDVDETLESYSKADGSRWLSHRRANPSLTGFIWRRIVGR